MRYLLITLILLLSCVGTSQHADVPRRWVPPDDVQMNVDAFLTLLIGEGTSWIRSQREMLRPTAAPLPEPLREGFAPYFRPETIDHVRYQMVDSIKNPDFYEKLAQLGFAVPLDFSQMDGITFIDTISVSRRNLERLDLARLLFHECIHVAQYKHLGPEEFASQYVRGWAENGFDYFAIPLERQAYALELRFTNGEVFSVEQIVTAGQQLP